MYKKTSGDLQYRMASTARTEKTKSLEENTLLCNISLCKFYILTYFLMFNVYRCDEKANPKTQSI